MILTPHVELIVLFWLFIKHFICDFPLQAFPYMYRNKGTYGHPGGGLHALIHVIGTYLVFIFFVSSQAALTLALIDGFIHYHVDWAKMYIGKKHNLRPDNSEWFWIFLGLDQLIHALTYFGLVIIFILMNMR